MRQVSKWHIVMHPNRLSVISPVLSNRQQKRDTEIIGMYAMRVICLKLLVFCLQTQTVVVGSSSFLVLHALFSPMTHRYPPRSPLCRLCFIFNIYIHTFHVRCWYWKAMKKRVRRDATREVTRATFSFSLTRWGFNIYSYDESQQNKPRSDTRTKKYQYIIPIYYYVVKYGLYWLVINTFI